jgi:hypothetical protein
MSKPHFLAVVRDAAGITVEVRAANHEDCLVLLQEGHAAVSALLTIGEAVASPACSAKVGEAVGANGQILGVLASLLQKAAAELPTLLPEILSIISLFGSTAPNGTKVGESVGANGAILTALGKLLQTAAAELPVILPEILQLISLFGGTVNVAPTPTPSAN